MRRPNPSEIQGGVREMAMAGSSGSDRVRRLTHLPGEEEGAIQGLVAGVVRRDDYGVLEAADGAQALEFAGRHCVPVDLWLADVGMPGGGWRELAERLKFTNRSARLAAISSQVDESLWAEVLNVGGYDVLPEPRVEDEVAWLAMLARQNWNHETVRSGRQPAPFSEKEILK